MTVKKWTVIGIIVVSLAGALITGEGEICLVAVGGFIGFLKSDEDK